MEWTKAIGYGLRFFIMSAIFTVMGLAMIASALSISFGGSSEGNYILSIDATDIFRNLGTFTLFVLGMTILIVGNAASFFKVLSEIVKDSRKDYLW